MIDNEEFESELTTSRKRCDWSPYEDEKLLHAVKLFNEKQWNDIALYVKSRSEVQCIQRWSVVKPGGIKGNWSEDEDKLLICAMAEGHVNWTDISKRMLGRTGKQCRERWHHHLDPNISKEPFSKEEDQLILSLYNSLGSRWAQIAEHLPNRSSMSIKTRFRSLAKCIENGKGIEKAQHRSRQSLKRQYTTMTIMENTANTEITKPESN